jgi:hypothetical protein
VETIKWGESCIFLIKTMYILSSAKPPDSSLFSFGREFFWLFFHFGHLPQLPGFFNLNQRNLKMGPAVPVDEVGAEGIGPLPSADAISACFPRTP